MKTTNERGTTKMPASKAQIKATRKWEKENYWKITVSFPKDFEARIVATGKTKSGFIREAVQEYLEKYEKM